MEEGDDAREEGKEEEECIQNRTHARSGEVSHDEGIGIGVTLHRNQLDRSAAVGLGHLARTVSSLRALDVSHNQVKKKKKTHAQAHTHSICPVVIAVCVFHAAVASSPSHAYP